MKSPILVFTVAWICTLCPSFAASDKDDPSKSSLEEINAMIVSLSDRITRSETYLPRLKEQLKESQSRYKALPPPPKGMIRMCGDTTSYQLNKEIEAMETKLKENKLHLEKWQQLQKQKKAEQDAAANP